jgi:hypothetical protein
MLIETFRGLVPICANTLTCQLYFVLAVLECLAETKICDLDLTIMENDVLRLEVIVDNLLLLVV